MFMNLWQAEGIDTSHVIRDPEAPTGIYFVTHTEAGHVFSYFRKGSAASLMRPDDVPEEAIARAKVLHVSGISQAISEGACDAVFYAIEVARSSGVKVSYDPNLRLKLWPLPRARAVVMETVGLSDICLPSLEDARALTSLAEPERIVDTFLGRGAQTVALKLGADGVLIASGSERHRIRGVQVEAVDATGAGDTFDGALLAELARGKGLLEAATYANAAAALATRGYGAVAPIPRREGVEAFLATV
jgi:2-dehydro-3-deoxygluconokinase